MVELRRRECSQLLLGGLVEQRSDLRLISAAVPRAVVTVVRLHASQPVLGSRIRLLFVTDTVHALPRSVGATWRCANQPSRQDRLTSPELCSAKCTTLGRVSSVPPLSLRLGREGLRALDVIARRRGVSRAEAARQAIAETAERERRRRGLAAEAAALVKDPAYVREAREVAALMEQLRGSR